MDRPLLVRKCPCNEDLSQNWVRFGCVCAGIYQLLSPLILPIGWCFPMQYECAHSQYCWVVSRGLCGWTCAKTNPVRWFVAIRRRIGQKIDTVSKNTRALSMSNTPNHIRGKSKTSSWILIAAPWNSRQGMLRSIKWLLIQSKISFPTGSVQLVPVAAAMGCRYLTEGALPLINGVDVVCNEMPIWIRAVLSKTKTEIVSVAISSVWLSQAKHLIQHILFVLAEKASGVVQVRIPIRATTDSRAKHGRLCN